MTNKKLFFTCSILSLSLVAGLVCMYDVMSKKSTVYDGKKIYIFFNFECQFFNKYWGNGCCQRSGKLCYFYYYIGLTFSAWNGGGCKYFHSPLVFIVCVRKIPFKKKLFNYLIFAFIFFWNEQKKILRQTARTVIKFWWQNWNRGDALLVFLKIKAIKLICGGLSFRHGNV